MLIDFNPTQLWIAIKTVRTDESDRECFNNKAVLNDIQVISSIYFSSFN